MDVVAGINVGDVYVTATQNRGATPEEIAERALNRIIFVGANAHPHIAEQARAYREELRKVLIFYLTEAVRSHNTTLINKLTNAGYSDIASILNI